MDKYRYFVGDGVEMLARRAATRCPESEMMQFVVEYRQFYAERADRNTRPYAGIPEMLDAIAARKLPFSVLSNKRDDFSVALVKRVFPKWTFFEVRGEREGTPRKPDPQSALEMARALKLPAAEIAFVGDTSIDMFTANAAGMLSIGVSWGFRGEEELRAAGAKKLIHAPMELIPLLD